MPCTRLPAGLFCQGFSRGKGPAFFSSCSFPSLSSFLFFFVASTFVFFFLPRGERLWGRAILCLFPGTWVSFFSCKSPPCSAWSLSTKSARCVRYLPFFASVPGACCFHRAFMGGAGLHRFPFSAHHSSPHLFLRGRCHLTEGFLPLSFLLFSCVLPLCGVWRCLMERCVRRRNFLPFFLER